MGGGMQTHKTIYNKPNDGRLFPSFFISVGRLPRRRGSVCSAPPADIII